MIETFKIFRKKAQSLSPSFMKSRHFIFFLLNLSTALDLLNVTALLVSTQYISTHYGITPAKASWSLSSYAVTFSGFIAFFGRTGDIIGHNNQFVIMSFLFSIASLLCAVIDNIDAYIVFRAFQGLFAAGLIPTNYAITAHLYQNKHLSTAITVLTGTLTLSMAMGLVIGGAFLRTSVAIHGVAYLSFGLAFLWFVLAIFSFPEINSTSSDKLEDLDYVGSSILISGLLLIIVGFTEGGESWKSPKSYVTLIIGVLLLGFFFIYEKYICLKWHPSTHLLIPPQVWKIPNYAPLVFNSIMNYAGFFGSMFISVSYFLNIDKVSPLIAGLRYLPFIISLITVTSLMTYTNGKFSQKLCCVVGFLIGFVGLILLTRLSYTTSNNYWKFSLTNQILMSAGSGLYFVNYLNMVLHNAPLELQGIVTGIAQTFGQFGIALTFAVITSIVGNSEKMDIHTLNQKYQYASWFCVGCYGIGTLLLIFFVHEDSSSSDSVQEEHDYVDDETKTMIEV